MADAVIGRITGALGATPAEVTASGYEVTVRDLERVLQEQPSPEPLASAEPGAHEIWPLVSHHPRDGQTFIGGAHVDVRPRVLRQLLLHDGIVFADPVVTIENELATGLSAETAVRYLQRVVRDLAHIQPLIDAGVVRFTRARPALTEEHRVAVLDVFGLDPRLRVFTNIFEALTFDGDRDHMVEQFIGPEIQDLYQRFGIRAAAPRTKKDALAQSHRLAGSVLEVSWQFAVASTHSSCDLAFRDPMEWHLARNVLEAGLGSQSAGARHWARLDMGAVPNLDPAELTVADAMAIRRDDMFEEFRTGLRSALDELDRDATGGLPDEVARARFTEAMRSQARTLSTGVQSSSFKERARLVGVPASIAVAGGLAASEFGPLASATSSVASTAVTVVWQWLQGRRISQSGQVARRYLSMLSGDESRTPAGRR